MTVQELKKRLIGEINKTQDPDILEVMYRLILNQEDDDDFFELSEEQIKNIEEGQKEYREGKYLTEDESNEEINRLLGI